MDKFGFFKKIFFYFFCLLFLLVFFELFLFFTYKVTNNQKLNVIADNTYPRNPKNYIKIAIFGGSSAMGYGTERSFTDILEFELVRRYPKSKFYIKNYARSGYPFHRHQAEILKKVIDKYDYFLIYSGHNELHNYLDDTGYFRYPKYKSNKQLIPIEVFENENVLLNFLERKSRTYAIIVKFKNLVNEKFRRSQDKFLKYRNIQEFASRSALPQEEIKKIINNYGKDLEEIGKLADRKNKQVVISSVPVNEMWKPNYSKLNPDLPGKAKKDFYKYFKLGVNNYNAENYSQAINYFEAARKIDAEVAIVNYFIGRSYYSLNDLEKAHFFLRKSSDNEGIPFRALSPLRDVQKSVSEKYANLYFVDTIDDYYRFLENGIEYNELFLDFQHPSFMGHIIISNNFLTKLSNLQPLNINGSRQKIYKNHDAKKLRSLFSNYWENLNVTEDEVSKNALMISKWHLGMSDFSAYPDEYLEVAEDYILKFYLRSEKTDDDKAMLWLFRGLISSKNFKNDKQKVADYLNKANKFSPKYIQDIVNNKELVAGEYVANFLKRKGIIFSKKQNKYILRK